MSARRDAAALPSVFAREEHAMFHADALIDLLFLDTRRLRLLLRHFRLVFFDFCFFIASFITSSRLRLPVSSSLALSSCRCLILPHYC